MLDRENRQVEYCITGGKRVESVGLSLPEPV